MTSDSERREVAQGLRELRRTTYYREEIVENICDAISIADPVNTFREPEDVYELLADLVDRPTCHDVADFDRESFKCSRCGFRVLSIDGAPDAAKLVGTKGGVIDFGYCPNCGAEVKDDAEPNLKEN